MHIFAKGYLSLSLIISKDVPLRCHLVVPGLGKVYVVTSIIYPSWLLFRCSSQNFVLSTHLQGVIERGCHMYSFEGFLELSKVTHQLISGVGSDDIFLRQLHCNLLCQVRRKASLAVDVCVHM